MDTKIYWLEDFFKVQELEPFDRNKDFIINARGRKNRNRYLYNLEKVNVFYLNYSPPQWAMDYYKKEFPGEVGGSLFSFIHGAHLDIHISLLQSAINVISWRGAGRGPLTNYLPGVSFPGLVINTASCAVIDYLGQILRGRNIYLTAWDFDRKRDWGQEAGRVKGIITKHRESRNVFFLINYNEYFGDIIAESQCLEIEKELLDSGIITKKLTDQKIEENYSASGQATFELIHPGT